jgi:transposase
MSQPNDLSRSLVPLDQDSTIIAVVEMSQSSWLVGGVLPGIERQPHKKLEPSPERLLALLHRWRDESVRAGRTITRIAVAFEAGRDGFWLARWLEARGVEAHVIHPSSVVRAIWQSRRSTGQELCDVFWRALWHSARTRDRAAARNCQDTVGEPVRSGRNRWFVDSPLEGGGFEPSVPHFE